MTRSFRLTLVCWSIVLLVCHNFLKEQKFHQQLISLKKNKGLILIYLKTNLVSPLLYLNKIQILEKLHGMLAYASFKAQDLNLRFKIQHITQIFVESKTSSIRACPVSRFENGVQGGEGKNGRGGGLSNRKCDIKVCLIMLFLTS